MKIDPVRARALVSQLTAVKSRIACIARDRNVRLSPPSAPVAHDVLGLSAHTGLQVRLVAVSKLKPANDILALHQAPASHLHFGENYAQELSQKVDLLPKTIQWHFIGSLQSGQLLVPLPFLQLAVASSRAQL